MLLEDHKPHAPASALPRKPQTVAEFLTAHIASSGKSQFQIAEEVGYDNPNNISIKQGRARLPITRVERFAKALGVDPAELLSLVLSQYMPETWESIRHTISEGLLTEDEKNILNVIRDALGGRDAYLDTAADREALIRIVEGLPSR